MARTKKAPVVEVDDDLDELEELEDDEEPTPKAKKAAKKPRRAASEDDEETSAYGATWLAEFINEQTGKEYTAANLRVLLRKLARSGELDREVGVDRGRYEFTGPNDPIVKAVLKHVKAGAIEKEKNERLAEVKDKKAAKAKAAAEVEDDDEDDEDEKPVPKKKGRPAKAAAVDEDEDEKPAPKKATRRR